MKDSKIFIFANGELRNPNFIRAMIHPDDFVIAADGGGMHLAALGKLPDVVIGDMDSISQFILAEFQKSGCQVLRYPAEKDETDLELAIQFAIQKGETKWVIAAGLGGRMDQTLGNLSLVTAPGMDLMDIRFEDGIEEAWFIHGGATSIIGSTGDIVSLLPWGGPVTGVTTSGLKYPLVDEILSPDKSRGISNVLISPAATVLVKSGRLLCIHTRI